MPKVSVIIPVYNTENYLRECLDSVLAQTFTDFEVLVINDGSTDKSGEICDEYDQKDARVKVFHKENGGVSSARNLGLENATGEWICFVDSDDFLNEQFLTEITRESYNHNSDIILQSLTRLPTSAWFDKAFSYSEEELKIPELLNRFNIIVYGFVAGKLFKNNMINKNKICFDTSLSYGEDCKFLIDYLCHSQTIFMSRSSNYFYRNLDTGLSSRYVDFKSRKKEFLKINTSLKLLMNKANIKTLKFKDYYMERLLIAILNNKLLTKKEKSNEINYLLNNYQEEVLSVYKGSNGLGFFFYSLLKFNFVNAYCLIYNSIYQKS